MHLLNLGQHNYIKDLLGEYLLLEQLRLHSLRQNELFKSITQNLPADFNYSRYSRVWRYDSSSQYEKRFNIDIYAPAINTQEFSIIGEVKSRDSRKFSREEVLDFQWKYDAVRKIEKID